MRGCRPALVERRLGGWRLRAAAVHRPGQRRLAVGDPGRPIPEALRAAREFALEHGIPARVHTPVGSPGTGRCGQGWSLEVEHAAGPVSAVLVAPLDGTADPRVELSERPPPDWWRLGPGDPRPPRNAGWSPRPDPCARGSAGPRREGGAGRHLRAAVVEDHLHLALLAVAPAARRGAGPRAGGDRGGLGTRARGPLGRAAVAVSTPTRWPATTAGASSKTTATLPGPTRGR